MAGADTVTNVSRFAVLSASHDERLHTRYSESKGTLWSGRRCLGIEVPTPRITVSIKQ